MSHIHEKIDFITGTLIVYKDRVLLIDHIARKNWLPLGGHIELAEDSDEALFREIREESGLKRENLTILTSKPSRKDKGVKFLFTPNFLDIHEFSDTHKHMSLIYFLISDTDVVELNKNEHHDIKWFSKDELNDKKYNISPHIKFYAIEAFKKAKEFKKSKDKNISNTSTDQQPKVGIGIMIFKDGKVLLGKRKGSHGEGEYAFPGGHLEFGESFEDCAKRESKEETGIEIDNVRFQFLANVKKYSEKHYVHIGLIADWKSGEPKILEPKRSESWGWYSLKKGPHPLFEFCKLAYKSYKTKQNYFDS